MGGLCIVPFCGTLVQADVNLLQVISIVKVAHPSRVHDLTCSSQASAGLVDSGHPARCSKRLHRLRPQALSTAMCVGGCSSAPTAGSNAKLCHTLSHGCMRDTLKFSATEQEDAPYGYSGPDGHLGFAAKRGVPQKSQ